MRQKRTVRASSVSRRRGVWLGRAIFFSLVRGDYDGPLSISYPRNTHLGDLSTSASNGVTLRSARKRLDAGSRVKVFMAMATDTKGPKGHSLREAKVVPISPGRSPGWQ